MDLEQELINVNERLALYLAAERNILEGAQMYTVGGNQKVNASLKEVRDTIKMLQKEKDRLELMIDGINPGIIVVNPTML